MLSFVSLFISVTPEHVNSSIRMFLIALTTRIFLSSQVLLAKFSSLFVPWITLLAKSLKGLVFLKV